MLKNYLKIAARNLLKYKVYSFINIAGLAIGMACCIMILLFVQEELSYDRFHEYADRIYRMVVEFKHENQSDHFAHTPAPLARLCSRNSPRSSMPFASPNIGNWSATAKSNSGKAVLCWPTPASLMFSPFHC